MKYIFVTGGVVSGLGKGITAASLGRLLKQRGYRIISQKLDPYINIDPGTMSPHQHGEVFVTKDGAETDLDLGHYERFIDEDLNRYSNLTSGRAYWNVLQKERKGEYLGETVQIIPHITDEIKRFIRNVGERANADITITEIGGTVGDIESQPFIEAIRQIGLEQPEDVCFMHVTLVPFIPGSEEYKSKPTQHSVRQLQNLGVMPDLIIARCDGHMPSDVRKKIALFCNVKPDCVIENTTVQDLYEAPLMLEEQNFSAIVCRELGLQPNEIDLTDWKEMVDRIHQTDGEVKIALVGKYVRLHDAYLSVAESLKHAGYAAHKHVRIKWVESEDVNAETAPEIFNDVSGICVPGGFGSRGIEGMIASAAYARENNIPYLGLCLGMQIGVIEFARHVLGYSDAHSNEFDESSTHKVIDFMENQSDEIDKGGTMRLGAYPCAVRKDTLLYQCYQQDLIHERHRHRYEFNNEYRNEFEEHGMKIAGTSPDRLLVEAVENENCDFFVGVQYHPEFQSRPDRPHPLFTGFLCACMKKTDA